MADEPSLGEVVRRLDRMEARLEQLITELSLRTVDIRVYEQGQREWERRYGELERDLEAERTARRDDVKALRDKVDKQGEQQSGHWRQALYGGVVPGLVVLVSVAVQLFLATRGGK